MSLPVLQSQIPHLSYKIRCLFLSHGGCLPGFLTHHIGRCSGVAGSANSFYPKFSLLTGTLQMETGYLTQPGRSGGELTLVFVMVGHGYAWRHVDVELTVLQTSSSCQSWPWSVCVSASEVKAVWFVSSPAGLLTREDSSTTVHISLSSPAWAKGTPVSLCLP